MQAPPQDRTQPATDDGDELLTRSLASGRIHSAYLIAGPGERPREAALRFVRGLVCEGSEPPCDACTACRRSTQRDEIALDGTGKKGPLLRHVGDHADLFWIERGADDTRVRIGQIRALQHALRLRSTEGGRRAAVIADAERMNQEAQNALLKLVEEPPPHAVAIFVTTNAEGILYTIRSRCQRVRFLPLKASVIERILTDYYDISKADAKRAARLAQGSIDRARNLVEASDDADRQAAVAFVEGITSKRESWAIGQATQIGRGSNRDGVARFLDEVAVVFRDAMTGERDLYVNVSSADAIDALARKWERRTLPRVIERISRARGDILIANANVDSTLAELFLGLKRMQ